MREAGSASVVLDNRSTCHRQAVEGSELVVGDLPDATQLEQVFAQHQFDAVMHFCAKLLVGESMREPYDD
jgi:UDP-glucose 4-epimerase